MSKKFSLLVIVCVLFCLYLTGCSALKKRPEGSPLLKAKQTSAQPLSPEETKELMTDVGENWLYGEGIGSTTLNVGTAIAFPPYAFYLLGNSALYLAGYDTIGISDALEGEDKEAWNDIYSSVVSCPGKAAAALAGEEFRTQEMAKNKLKKYTVTAQPEVIDYE